MKRVLMPVLLAIAVVAAAAGGYLFASSRLPQAATAAQAAAPDAGMAGVMESAPAVQTLDGATVADARVVPAQVADLSLGVGGVVAELLVAEGESVQQGQVLLRLDASRQQVSVLQAQAGLQSAQARLAEVQAGARAEEIAAAQSSLEAAVARLERLANGAAPGQIAQAEASLAASSAQLAKLYEGADESALVAAEADLAAAEATLAQAQSAYDQVKWRNDIGALPQSAQLQQATIAWEAAQARLALLSAGPSAADVAARSAEVQRQQASLDTLENSLPGELAAAEADVAFSQAQLDLLLAGARPEAVSVAEADVAAATAQLQQALVALAETELRAPFAGTVAELAISAGEQLNPGAPVVTLADLSRWQVETEDLTELDVVGVQPGAAALITFDALPEVELEGSVAFIRPRGADSRGDIVYTAVVEPATDDSRLLWNMTAVVTIE